MTQKDGSPEASEGPYCGTRRPIGRPTADCGSCSEIPPGYKAQEQTLRAALGEREAVAAVLQSHQRRLSTPGYRLIDQSESESESEGTDLRRSERISEREASAHAVSNANELCAKSRPIRIRMTSHRDWFRPLLCQLLSQLA